MKHVPFRFLRFLMDAVWIPPIFITAYIVKFKIGWFFWNVVGVHYGRIYGHARVAPYLESMGVIVFLYANAFFLSGMYRRYEGPFVLVDELLAVIRGMTLGTIETMAIMMIYKPLPGSRFVLFYAWILGCLFYALLRFGYNAIRLWRFRKGQSTQRAIVVGADEMGQDVAERIILYPSLGFTYVGTIDDALPSELHYHLRSRFRALGNLDQFESLIQEHNCQVAFITRTDLSHEVIQKWITYCDQQNVVFKLLSDTARIKAGSVCVDDFDGLPFISVQRVEQLLWQRALKRILDIVISSVCLIVLSPLFLLVGLLIKSVSPTGPVFYTQTRVTRNGREFGMIKFRTMHPDAEKDTGPVMVSTIKENRYIPLGDFFRRMSIDELPQLVNVLIGDMSLVGPRPERPFFVAQFTDRNPLYPMRHAVKSGITGWAQVNGRSVLTDRPDQKLKYDLYYIKNWSLILDLKILIKTVLVVLRQEEAY